MSKHSPSLRELQKSIEHVGRTHGYYETFRDFLEYCVACFDFQSREDVSKRLITRYGDHYQTFIQGFYLLPKVYDELLGQLGWCDPLGDWYMEWTGRFKAKGMGQFFTPEHICHLMVELNPGETGAKLTVSDPTCGSGRFLLAYHALHPGNYQVGDDLDEMCVHMSVINMTFHGCVGAVNHMNSLTMQWFKGYHVNPWLNTLGTICVLRKSSYEDSFIPKRSSDTKEAESPIRIGFGGQMMMDF